MAARANGRIVVRCARPHEIGEVLDLWRKSREWTSKSDDPASLGALLERDRGALLVAELDGRIVGSLIAGGTAGAGTSTASPLIRRAGGGVSRSG